MSKIENVGNLMAAELDEVSGGNPVVAGVLLGYVLGKALDATPIGDVVDAIFAPPSWMPHV
jgi:hypothetical protein